jgi:predicted MFS family arabinose efflux permease
MSSNRFTSAQINILVTLALVNAVNFIDRQIIGALVPLIQTDFLLSHFQVSLLGTVFSLVHAVFTLPLGMLADRTSRKRVIGFGIVFWSAATFFSGLATSFRTLLGARALVGVGEAAFTPAAAAIITGSFPVALRARVQGVFDAGMFIGGCVGLGLGSVLAAWVGWRPALFIVALPGLLLAWRIARLREPRVEPSRPVPILQLLRIRAYVAVLVSGWFITFAAYGFIFWGTTFVHRVKGFELGEAGVILGANLLVAGVLGIVVGAALADRMMQRVEWGRIFIIALGLLLGVPFLFISFHTSNKPLFVVFFFIAGFFMSWYHGPLTAVLHDLTPTRAHATAVGLYNAFVHFFAVTWAPPVVGRVADRWGLLHGMHVALAAHLIGALCFIACIWFVRGSGRKREQPESSADLGGEDDLESELLPST